MVCCSGAGFFGFWPALRRGLLVLQLGDRHRQLDLAAAAPDGDGGAAADLGAADQARQVGALVDVLAIEFQDDVADPDAGLLGRPARLDHRDLGAVRAAQAERFGDVARDFADLHADAPARDLAGLLDLVGHAHHFVDRHRERDAVVGAGQGRDLGVDADDFAAHVDQGAARVARVDRDVALDQRQVLAGVARLGRDDAGRDRVFEVERRADRDHPFADADLAGIADAQAGQVARVDLQQGDVAALVGAQHLGLEFAPVGERDDDLVRALDHVGIGQHVAVVRDDETGADAALHFFFLGCCCCGRGARAARAAPPGRRRSGAGIPASPRRGRPGPGARARSCGC